MQVIEHTKGIHNNEIDNLRISKMKYTLDEAFKLADDARYLRAGECFVTVTASQLVDAWYDESDDSPLMLIDKLNDQVAEIAGLQEDLVEKDDKIYALEQQLEAYKKNEANTADILRDIADRIDGLVPPDIIDWLKELGQTL